MGNFEAVMARGASHNLPVVLETGFVPCVISTGIDKERLFKAVNLRKKGAEVDFAFEEKLFLNRTTSNPLKIDKLGDIPIPVSVKDIQRVKEICEIGLCGRGLNRFFDSSKRLAFQIDASKLTSTIIDDLNLLSIIMHHLNLPSDLMNVQAKLHQLILFESDGHYQRTSESEKEYGSFGTIVLQLPVEGGHEGGRFKVQYRGKEQVFDNHQDSDRCFYASSFYGNCQHSMEPITKGVKLTLVFHLVWANAEKKIPLDFPVFLTALKNIKGSLPTWIRNRKGDNQNKNPTNDTLPNEADASFAFEALAVTNSSDNHSNEKPDSNSLLLEAEENTSEIVSTEGATSKLSEDCNDNHNQTQQQTPLDVSIQDGVCTMGVNACNENKDEDQDENQDEEDCTEEYEVGTFEENVLYFVLEGNYVEDDFTFLRLKGKDRELAQLLQCCGFLDTHLAVVTKTVSTTRSEYDPYYSRKRHHYCDHEKTKSANKISRWIDSKNISKKLNMDLNWMKQCVGPLRNLPTSDSGTTGTTDSEDECDECGGCDDWNMTTTEEHSHYFILVIWPKHQSVQMYCRYGLHSLLENMEIKISSTRWLTKNQQNATESLRTIISFCSADPWKVWTQTSLEKGELTRRLLNLCIVLRAREEGLSLLKIIASDYPLPQERVSSMQGTFEGIQTRQVAKAIAELECLVIGWKDSADLIRKMISPDRIVQQLVPIISLAQHLFNFHCLEGAALVGDLISSSLINFNKQQTQRLLKQSEIQSYVEFMISLEENAKTANPLRPKSLTTVFSKLESSIQCNLILELEAQVSSRLKNLDSCNNMFQELCKALPLCDLRSPLIKENVIVDLVFCYFRIGNEELLQTLISNVFHVSSTPGGNKLNSSEEALEKVISSPLILELALSSEIGLSVVLSLVDKQLISITSKLQKILHGEAQPPANVNRLYQKNETQLLLSLSSCLRIVVRVEKNSSNSTAQPSSSISSLLSKLNAQQLTTVLNDILKSSSRYLKKPSSTATIIHQICVFLISRLNENTTAVLSRSTILQSIKAVIEVNDESLSQILFQQFCEKEEIGSWSKQNKSGLLRDILSSPEVWGKLDSSSRQIIMDTCASLVNSWIVEISLSLNSLIESTATQINAPSKLLIEAIVDCVQLFFWGEKNRFDLEQKITAEAFQPLICKLNASQLLDLVLQLYKSEFDARPNIKKFPICMDWYRSTCRILFTMEFVSLVNLDVATRIVNCLLWLEDEESWKQFAQSVCKNFLSSRGNLFVQIFLKDLPIQRALKDFAPAFVAFLHIVDHWAQQSVNLKEPPFSWHQSNAVVPNNPEVQAFLRSPEESMIYMKFNGIADARRLAVFLQVMGQSNNFSVSVTTSGSGKNSRCDIRKNRNHFERRARDFFSRKAELIELVKLRNRLGQEIAQAEQLAAAITSTPVATDEVCVVPPPKRPKLDVPVIELE